MTVKQPSFTFGIEEEYFLIDQQTRDLASKVPQALLATCQKRLGDLFSLEFMHAQVEVCTPVCSDMETARESLANGRKVLADAAHRYGLAPIAAASHPSARWSRHRHTDKPRYDNIADEFQGVGRRMVINGLHVHVGIGSNVERIRLMNGVRPLLPLLLALSTSSPFWAGERTGLKSYRTAINDATPRKGIPETFADWRDYQRTVGALQKAGLIDDASKIWWDLRPSAAHPTLEMRITDGCPNLEDSLCLAALFRCYCRYLSRTPEARWPSQSLGIINENRWRAERYGLDEGLIDWTSGRIVPIGDMVDDLLETIAQDAEELNCANEVEHARHIVEEGTSADRQLACYWRLRKQGRTAASALRGVVDQLAAETVSEAASEHLGVGRLDISTRALAAER